LLQRRAAQFARAAMLDELFGGGFAITVDRIIPQIGRGGG
jgi:hypothetical protein